MIDNINMKIFTIEDGKLWEIAENDLEVITVPEGVTSIENNSFDKCTNLKEVYFPASVMKICHGIFENCRRLKKIEISSDNPYFEERPINGELYEKNRFMVVLLENRDGQTLDIPEGVVRIAADHESMNDIIGLERAAKHYRRIVIPSTMQHMITPAIMDAAKNVSEISVHEDNKYFTSEDGVLFTKNRKMLVYYPRMREGAYRIPDTVTSISRAAFRRCERITELYVPGSLKWFRATIAYSSITAIHFDEGVKTIQGYNFFNCNNIKEITFPESVSFINGGCFNSCSALKSLTFLSKKLYFLAEPEAEPDKEGVLGKPKRLLYLPMARSFDNCKALERISFPNLEEGYIPLDFLNNCPSLKYLRIGKYEIASANPLDTEGLVFNSGDDIPFVQLCFVNNIIDDKNYLSAAKAKPNTVVSVIAATDFINDNDKNAEKYIRENTTAVFNRLIYSENTLLIKKLLNSGKFVSADNIEGIIKLAINHTQNGGSIEPQILITQYSDKLRSGIFTELEI